LRNTKR